MLKEKFKTLLLFSFGTAAVLITVFSWNSFHGTARGESAQTYTIYDDHLNDTFANWSWNGNVSLSEAANVQSGSNAISFTLTSAWAGFYVHTENQIDTTSYKEITLSMKAAQDGLKYGVTLYDNANQPIKDAVLLDNYGGQPGTDWKTYTIPLTDLDGVNKQIRGISITEKSGATNGTVYIDNILLRGLPDSALLNATEPTVTASSSSTSASSEASIISPAPLPEKAQTGNPLSGAVFYNDPTSNPAAKQVEEWTTSRTADAEMIKKIADQPKATWLGNWTSNIEAETKSKVDRASTANAVPVFIAYNIPGRDCGSYSAGGSSTGQAYKDWITGLTNGIGNRRAVVILEPDSLAQDCLQGAAKQERYDLLNYAIQKLKALGKTTVYIDAGHSSWIAANDMAARLNQAGIAHADGFALNVSNFQTTEASIAYGSQISSQINGKHFIIDTTRNGNGPATDNAWCNPTGRALGEKPTTSTGNAIVDGFLWLKYPGESDGTCNGGPNAGQWYPEYALNLAKNAKW